MTDRSSPLQHWTLAHAWHSDGDRAALALCAAALRQIGVEFGECADAASADAAKMHGFEIIDALQASAPPLADLRDAAQRGGWQARLDPRPLRYMGRRQAVHGIPVAIHQSNCLWANAQAVAETGAAGDLRAWLQAAARRIPKPLAIGSEPWQIGILFESLALAMLGAQAYEQAFVQRLPETLSCVGMRAVLEELAALRDFVDEDALLRPWRSRLDDVNAGRAALMAMGDWVGAGLPAHVDRLYLDGFREECIFVADFFVPLERGDDDLARRVALALTATDFQARFSSVKGSLAAVIDAQAARPFAAGRIDAPSLTFDQCCPVRTKLRMLEIVADHFLERRDAAETAAALVAAAT